MMTFNEPSEEALYLELIEKGMSPTEAVVAVLEWENPSHAAAQKLVEKGKALLGGTDG